MLQKIVFNHPSVKRLQPTNPNTIFSEFGVLQSNKPISFFIKNKSVQNGSIPSRDVSINGSYSVKSFRSIESNNIYNNFPNLVQFIGMCQSIPFLHMIQSQIPFPIDYDALWNCVEADFNIYGSIITNIENFLGDNNYTKLYNLLFSGKCFSIKEDICRDNREQAIGASDDNQHCDNECFLRIKIRTIKESPIYTEEDLCERINSLGPRFVGCYGLTTIRLEVLGENPNLTWDIVRNMTFETLNTYLSEPHSSTFGLGHALTIIGCSDGEFILLNSYGGNNTISISYEELQSDFALNSDLIENALEFLSGIRDLFNYYPIVEPCLPLPSRNLEQCKENLCKDKGYDGLKPDYSSNSANDCDCNCDEVTAPATGGILNSNCLNAGEKVQKVYGYASETLFIQGECSCPPHPKPLLYYYEGEYCCELDFPGSWCEQSYCEQTDTYYQTGVEQSGFASEYEQLNEDQLAIGWEKFQPRNTPCVDEYSSYCNQITPPP